MNSSTMIQRQDKQRSPMFPSIQEALEAIKCTMTSKSSLVCVAESNINR